MSFTVLIDSVEIRCESASDVMALLALRSHSGQTMPSAARQTPFNAAPASTLTKSVEFLRRVQNAGKTGASSATIAQSLHLPNANSLGTLVAKCRKHLEVTDVDFDDAVQKKRVGDNKGWVAGEKIGKALEALTVLLES